MGLGRFILRPVAYVAGRHADRQRRQFLLAHRRTAATQEAVLAELLATHAETDFGRDHGFGSIRTVEDFRKAVPLGGYESHRPYIRRVLEGRPEALLPPGQAPLMFSMTSGTTGEPKHIPVTRRFLSEMRRGWNIFGLSILRDHPEGWLRPILQISSPMDDTHSPTGVPCGAISGLLAATQKKIVRRMYVTPRHALRLSDPAAKYYAILRFAVPRDVCVITTANPSSTIKLIETAQAHAERLVRDIADGTFNPPGGEGEDFCFKFRCDRALALRLEQGISRDGKLLPRHFWKVAFLTNWTGGTLGLYLPRLRELFDDVPIRDIGLLASEGRLSLPLEDGTPAGVAEITANFLEFIPAEQRESENPETLRAEEVQVGREYFIVLSNWAGLWRYNIDDRVRVVDRLGDSPVIEFLSRGLHTANITGEKITEHQVVEAMRRASAATGTIIERFVMQGRFADLPYYEVRLEESVASAGLALRMDQELCRLNMEYESKRKGGRLGPIRCVLLPEGQFERAETEKLRLRRGRSEQYKHQYLLTEVLV